MNSPSLTGCRREEVFLCPSFRGSMQEFFGNSLAVRETPTSILLGFAAICPNGLQQDSSPFSLGLVNHDLPELRSPDGAGFRSLRNLQFNLPQRSGFSPRNTL